MRTVNRSSKKPVLEFVQRRTRQGWFSHLFQQRMTALVPVLLTITLSACGTNPVTGKRELQFVSEAQEVQIGEQNYAPTRQSQGGDFIVLPELTTYVNEVGQKLVAVSDRKLPYEFKVLNSSVPNAWALPGGKIAVNRGLLTELKNEGELAAVLGHEIVHAAARHGAKAQERGTLLQIGMAATQIGAALGGVDQNVAGLLVQGAGLGAQLVQMKYGRDQELESDKYGMKYMKLAGYDPTAAVGLQETFVRLSEQGERRQNWVEGLFASHPPSTERVEQNERTAAELGTGGQIGADTYSARMQPLMKIKPAYDKHDQAIAAVQKKDFAQAKALTEEAVKLLPREGRFQQTLAEIALAEDKPQEAIPYYRKAMELDPNYFGSYLGAGIAQYRTGNKVQAEEWLERSAQLLPTVPAAYFLGHLAREKGDTQTAMKYYQAAAGSDSEMGRRAAAEFVRLDLPQNPSNYVAVGGELDAQGRLLVLVENRAPVPLSSVQITPVLLDASGRPAQQGQSIRINRRMAPGERIAADSGAGQIPREQLPYVRFRIDGARVAE